MKTLVANTYAIFYRLMSIYKVTQNLAAKPNYVSCKIVDENLIAVHMKKQSFTLINQSILV